MGRNRPRNRLGQFASYRSMMEDVAESSKVPKETILVDTDSEEMDHPSEEQTGNLQSSAKAKRAKPSGLGKNPTKGSTTPKFPRFFPPELYPDSETKMEESSDDVDYEYSSDDVECMMNDLDKVFAKAEAKMCSRVDGDPTKTKKVIAKVMEWLYEKVAEVKLAPRKKKARKGTNQK